MRRRLLSQTSRIAVGSLFLLCAAHLGQPLPAAPVAITEEALAIVVNKANPVTNLSFAELRQVFLAERNHWSNGRKSVIAMREPGQPERAAVLRQIYRMNESDYNRHFLQLNYSGESQSSPKQLATAEKVRKFVLNVPGAIGYVRASEVDDSVKLVRIDGLAPSDTGYKLKSSER